MSPDLFDERLSAYLDGQLPPAEREEVETLLRQRPELARALQQVRELGDGIRESRFVRTVHGRGYAFCGEATAAQPFQSTPGAITCWLEWGRQRFPLGVGQHIIGRDADVTVCLRGATVSRRHARLVVTSAGAELSDCDSKNGTYRGGERVVEPVRLADGDTIGVGSLRVTFREPGKSGSTLTQADAGS